MEYFINEGVVPETLAENGARSGSAPGGWGSRCRFESLVKEVCQLRDMEMSFSRQTRATNKLKNT